MRSNHRAAVEGNRRDASLRVAGRCASGAGRRKLGRLLGTGEKLGDVLRFPK